MAPPNPYEPPRPVADNATERNRDWVAYSPEYKRALGGALVVQAALAVLTALILDGGRTHRLFWIVFLAQWAATWIILFRRPRNPTRLDLALVRYGIVVLFIAVLALRQAFA